jgi:hypothetical protein
MDYAATIPVILQLVQKDAIVNPLTHKEILWPNAIATVA